MVASWILQECAWDKEHSFPLGDACWREKEQFFLVPGKATG
jgi:hypothetical protein